MLKELLNNRPAHRQRAPLTKSLINWILPPVCIGCASSGSSFCDDCVAAVEWITPRSCFRCGSPAPNLGSVCSECRTASSTLNKVYAATLFAGPIRPAVHALKYQGKFGMAQPLAALMRQAWDCDMQVDALIPVPLHPERRQARGYNQSESLATHLTDFIAAPLLTDGLFRVRATKQQVGLSERQRQRNVQHAFQAVPERVSGKHILLIDDVCTTGATLIASANALAQAGAASVSAYCLAQARDPHDHHFDSAEITRGQQ